MNKTIRVIAKKELMGLMYSPLGYVLMGLMAMLAIWLFMGDLFMMGSADVTPLVTSMAFLLSVFIPILGMGIFADEKRSGTWENLVTWPVSEGQIVMGKFLGYGVYLILSVGLVVPAMASLMVAGYSEAGVIATNTIMLLVLAWCFLGVTMVASSLTNQPMVAMGVSVVALLINNLMGNASITSRLAPEMSWILSQLSLSWRTQRLGNGLIEADNIWFLVSFILSCLLITTLILKSRSK